MSEPESQHGTQIVTLGCRLNTLESEVMRDHAREYAKTADEADTIIVNTCAVTAEAERQARQTIRRLRRERPGARIIVTGCAAQLSPERFAAMEEVDRVIGNAEKLNATSLLGMDGGTKINVSDISQPGDAAHHLVSGLEGRARAFVQVQQGCDNTCTFCIIPAARGPNRAMAIGDIVQQVQKLADGGYNEVVLTGVDIAAYGDDLNGDATLTDVIAAVLDEVKNLKRLRLSSLDPARIDAGLIALFGNESRLAPHVHLSLQAADDMVLKRMKRRHRIADVARVMAELRAVRADMVFGADLIAGFPTETDAMFENTLGAVERLGLTYLHVFPYSARPGTAAAKMPPVNGDVVKARARILRDVGENQLERHLQSKRGETLDVLVERAGMARSACYAPVSISGPAEPGTMVRARIAGVDGARLVGEVVAP